MPKTTIPTFTRKDGPKLVRALVAVTAATALLLAFLISAERPPRCGWNAHTAPDYRCAQALR